MKNIRFIPSGNAISDFEISKFVDAIFASSETEFEISTAMVIDEIRARVAEKKLKIDDFQIWVESDIVGEQIPFNIDKDGRSSDWQKSQEVHDNILDRILGI